MPISQLAIDREDSSADAQFFLERTPAHRRNTNISSEGRLQLQFTDVLIYRLLAVAAARDKSPARTCMRLAEFGYPETVGWRGSSMRFNSSPSTLIATSNAEIARIGKTTIHQASRMKCCPLCSR